MCVSRRRRGTYEVAVGFVGSAARRHARGQGGEVEEVQARVTCATVSPCARVGLRTASRANANLGAWSATFGSSAADEL
jgi:hypothetical protein